MLTVSGGYDIRKLITVETALVMALVGGLSEESLCDTVTLSLELESGHISEDD